MTGTLKDFIIYSFCQNGEILCSSKAVRNLLINYSRYSFNVPLDLQKKKNIIATIRTLTRYYITI